MNLGWPILSHFCSCTYSDNNNNRFTALCPGLRGWAGTRRNTHPSHILIIIQSLSASSSYHSILLKLHAWQSFCTTSFHVLFGLLLGLELSTSYSIHFFTQSVSSFRSTCPYHCNLFCCSISIISSIHLHLSWRGFITGQMPFMSPSTVKHWTNSDHWSQLSPRPFLSSCQLLRKKLGAVYAGCLTLAPHPCTPVK